MQVCMVEMISDHVTDACFARGEAAQIYMSR